MKRIGAVVVTYNRKELLKESIEALLDSEYDKEKYELNILIIDNASTDGTHEYIKDLLNNKRVTYENTGANLGGAGGFNYGMRKAVEEANDFIWIMDDDCIVHKDTLKELLKADKNLNGNYGFLSSKVLWKDDSICKMNIPKKTFATWMKNFNKSYQKIAMASFVSLFLKTSVIEKMGLPIKDFFIWTDDWEFTRRISRKYKCYYIAESIVTHKSKNNEGASIAEVDDRLERFNYLYRNDVVLYRREGLIGWILLYIRLFIHKRRIKKSNKINKDERISIIDKNIKEGKKFFPKIEYAKRKLIRVLQMFGEPISSGGQESCIMSYYRFIDKSKIQFDFFTPFYCNNESMKKEIEKLGGNVYALNGKFESKLRKFYFYKNTKMFLKYNKYDVIHINSGSLYELAAGSKIANKSGAKKIITHSHATGINNFKYKLVRKKYLKYFCKYPTDLLACSIDAAKWKYPVDTIEENNYKIIKNGIDLSKFYFNDKDRKSYRERLDIDDKKVLINIGRFSKEKNQLFLIEIVKKLVEQDKSFVLLLIGEGEMEKQLKDKIELYKLEKHVRFLGFRNDIPQLLNASDLFLFPSKFEGLGIVAIEAQATGLPVIASENVSREANVSNNFIICGIESNLDGWVNKINELLNQKYNRVSGVDQVKKSGYDIKDSIKELEKVYLD